MLNNSTLSSDVIQNMTDFSTPIFSVNQAIFDSLKLLDVKVEVGNFWSYIKYTTISSELLVTFTIFTSVFLVVVRK